MVASALILFREGLEGALVVAIVLAYLRTIGRRDGFRAVWLGTAAGVAVSLVAAIILFVTVGDLEGTAGLVADASIGFSAAAVLTWMVFWMRRQARNIRAELHAKVDAALGTGSVMAMVGVVFFAVVREGIESALFFLALGGEDTAGGFVAAVVGGTLGLAAAVVVGFAFYAGGRRLDIRKFFTVSGGAILVFAAGLLTTALGALQSLGLGSVWAPVFNLESIKVLGDEAFLGGTLNGLMGWNPAPSLEMVLIWLLYLVVVGGFYLRGLRPLPAGQPVSSPATAGTVST